MTATELLVTRGAGARGVPKTRRRGIRHGGAIAFFTGPFAVLFLLFYLLPIGYAVWQSLQVIERDGTYGAPQQVFGGLQQYVHVFENGEFWASVGRMLLFGVVQVPVMLGLALLFALLLDSPILKGKKFFRLAFFAPYAVPGVIAAIMWGFLYSPNLSPFTDVTRAFDFLSPETVLWSIATTCSSSTRRCSRSPPRCTRPPDSTVRDRSASPGR
jgi:multiple sugar transport system permease protein